MRYLLRVNKMWWLFAAMAVAAAAAGARTPVGDFSRNSLEGWSEKVFEGNTQYDLKKEGGSTVLRAESRGTASGLVKEIRVDLEQTPYLNWRWKIETPVSGDFVESHKSGDDYAARIYVIVSGGLAVWNTRALNYVWARHAPEGTSWYNAYAGERAVMLALRSSTDSVGAWQREKRNIRDDFLTHFNKKVRYIHAVALMSDTDNTGKHAVAWYGDIYFTKD